MAVQPYLFFDGRCDEALAFYGKAVGAKVNMLMRYKDSPDKSMAHANGDKVMHANVTIGDSTILVSDGDAKGKTKFEGFGLSLTVATEAEADRYFNALMEGGQVQLPLTATFFSPRFGMLKDRFGVMWLVYMAPKNA